VRYFVDRFQTGYRRAVVERWLSRSSRYLEMIQEVFAQRGLPEELAFTAMIESGFDPVAVSRAGAKGLWQFMAPTARRYGLRVPGKDLIDTYEATRGAGASAAASALVRSSGSATRHALRPYASATRACSVGVKSTEK